jgi:hypothetical protein
MFIYSIIINIFLCGIKIELTLFFHGIKIRENCHYIEQPQLQIMHEVKACNTPVYSSEDALKPDNC